MKMNEAAAAVCNGGRLERCTNEQSDGEIEERQISICANFQGHWVVMPSLLYDQDGPCQGWVCLTPAAELNRPEVDGEPR